MNHPTFLTCSWVDGAQLTACHAQEEAKKEMEIGASVFREFAI